MTENKMIDIAVDLLHDIDLADASNDPVLIAQRNRVTAQVMRESGVFTDADIIQELGYLPEPYGEAKLSGCSRSHSDPSGSKIAKID